MNLDRVEPAGRVARRLLFGACLSVAGAAAHAAPQGYNVDAAQEAQVTPGMSTEQVLTVLGRPTRNVKYMNQPGPTFTYKVVGHNDMLFDVDFGADGQVASSGERMDMSRGGGGRMGRGGR